jgi:hypothetical protein
MILTGRKLDFGQEFKGMSIKKHDSGQEGHRGPNLGIDNQLLGAPAATHFFTCVIWQSESIGAPCGIGL